MKNTPTAVASRLRGALTGTRGVVIGVGAAAVVAGAVLAPVAFQDDVAPPPSPAPGAAAPEAAAPPPTPGVVEFHGQAGFTLAYPSSWSRLSSPDPHVPLVVTQGPHSFLVRVLELPTPVSPQDLPAARKLTDQIVMADPSVKLQAEPKAVSVSGLPGYFYFYTFTDRESGLSGAHSHFFLFKGATMVVLVFQSMPADTFRAGADTFDQITASFRAE
jgi:hypothetical protein